MCMTKKELEEKIEEVRKYKSMAEEASNIQKALEQEIISYMNENNLTEEFTNLLIQQKSLIRNRQEQHLTRKDLRKI